MIRSSKPSSLVCPLATICGSKLPLRSRGIASSIAPSSPSTVLLEWPLRLLPLPRPARSPFSYPRCSLSSAPSARSSSFFLSSLKSPSSPSRSCGELYPCSSSSITSSLIARAMSVIPLLHRVHHGSNLHKISDTLLVAHPTEAHTVLAGGDTGLFVSHNGGARWERITANGAISANGANGAVPTIWSLAIDPVDPDILFAGTRPAAVYRSRDGGLRWEKLAVDIARECSIGTPFVTSVVVDPDDHRIVWAGVEIDGVFRSLDGGDTWTHLETGLYDPDIHAVTLAATQPKRLYASTAREVFTSSNLGETWQPLGIKEKWPLPYARGMMVKADDPRVLFAGCGETTTGEKGHVLRTTNIGESWEILPLPSQPNATVWGLATHPADPNRIVAFSLFGEVYVTENAGASWCKIAREFGEIRAAVWVPN